MKYENDKYISDGGSAGSSIGLVLGQEYSVTSLTDEKDEQQQWF